MQISRFTASKPSKFAFASDEKSIRQPTTSFVRCYLNPKSCLDVEPEGVEGAIADFVCFRAPSSPPQRRNSLLHDCNTMQKPHQSDRLAEKSRWILPLLPSRLRTRSCYFLARQKVTKERPEGAEERASLDFSPLWTPPAAHVYWGKSGCCYPACALFPDCPHPRVWRTIRARHA